MKTLLVVIVRVTAAAIILLELATIPVAGNIQAESFDYMRQAGAANTQLLRVQHEGRAAVEVIKQQQW